MVFLSVSECKTDIADMTGVLIFYSSSTPIMDVRKMSYHLTSAETYIFMCSLKFFGLKTVNGTVHTCKLKPLLYIYHVKNLSYFMYGMNSVIVGTQYDEISISPLNQTKQNPAYIFWDIFFHSLHSGGRATRQVHWDDGFVASRWAWLTHTCVSKLTTIGSDNGLSPIIVGILLIGHLGPNFSEISIEIDTFSFKKMHVKMSPGK